MLLILWFQSLGMPHVLWIKSIDITGTWNIKSYHLLLRRVPFLICRSIFLYSFITTSNSLIIVFKRIFMPKIQRICDILHLKCLNILFRMNCHLLVVILLLCLRTGRFSFSERIHCFLLFFQGIRNLLLLTVTYIEHS